MRLNFILALSIASAVTALPQGTNPPDKDGHITLRTKLFCNNGTEGDGGCEANGLATFCCIGNQASGAFNTMRLTTVKTKNKAGEALCQEAPNGIQGVRFCA
ncbi:hypothetical protein HYALB_00013096 [Hymenoscyphus albidus]|uniref:Hydrophobin n=1 Tax=Hymenoscyphus albidus TaxID=595503 RepID=A0A9N9LSI4_9HELO|nr:hypothetical protein HYALB_00013096 [Hymenoscyphus albidus]